METRSEEERQEKTKRGDMTSMLKVLKERVPSLHGYVSCRDDDVDIYWTITSKVRRYEREERALTAEARQVYEPSYCSWKSTRKRRRGEEKPKESHEEKKERPLWSRANEVRMAWMMRGA